MTIEEFHAKYCNMCGTQRCFGGKDQISTCEHYNGEIDGLPKQGSFMNIDKILVQIDLEE